MGVTIFNSKCVVVTLFVILGAVLCSSPGAYAATGSEPNYATAKVDGDIGEWDTDPGGIDFFAEMIQAGGNGDQTTVLCHLFLRYDLSTNTLFVLVLTADGSKSIEEDKKGEETWIKVDGSIVVPSDSATFEWVGLESKFATGFEASFPLSLGTYVLDVHTKIFWDKESQTSALLNSGIPLYVVPEPAEILYFASIVAASGLFAAYKIKKK